MLTVKAVMADRIQAKLARFFLLFAFDKVTINKTKIRKALQKKNNSQKQIAKLVNLFE